MAAVVVVPGRSESIRGERIARPDPAAVPDGGGVLVRVLRVGLCGTDREIVTHGWGRSPAGTDILVLGHENLGVVEWAGPAVRPELQPGTLVVASVRRPGDDLYDRLGRPDLTTDPRPTELGINGAHGFLAEWYAEDERFLVRLPETLREVGVLLEPLSIIEKGLAQAEAIQRRLPVWRPERAVVTGAGAIGLLTTLVLRLRGIDVICWSRREPPYRNSELVQTIGARYVSSQRLSLVDLAGEAGPFDLIVEATGFSPIAFDAARALGVNGVLVLTGVTPGDRTAEIPTDAINHGFVLENKAMVGTVNAALEHFRAGVVDMLAAEAFHPGWLASLLTTPVDGLDAAAIRAALDDGEAIKAYVRVAPGSVP